MIPRAELLITLFYGFEVTLNIPLISNTVRDSNMDNDNEENQDDDDGSPEKNPSTRVSSTFSTDSSEAAMLSSDHEKSPERHFNATFEDSEVEVPRIAKRMMGKRKCSHGAVQHSDSTSEDDQHPARLRTRSKVMHNQPSPAWTGAAPAKGTTPKKMERQQGKKQKSVGFQNKNPADSESSDATLLTGGPRKRQRKEKKNVRKHKIAIVKVFEHDSLTGRKRKTPKDPAGNEDSLSNKEETLHPGPLKQRRKNHEDPAEQESEDDSSSKNDKCLQKDKGKNVQPQVSEESESPVNKPVTRGEARKRRENEKNPTDPPGAEATPSRKRKRN